MDGGWGIVLGAVIAAVSAAAVTYAGRYGDSKRQRKESETAALKDLQVTLVAWYSGVLDLVDGRRDAQADRYPELRILMLAERVRDDSLRIAIDALVAGEGNVLTSFDPSVADLRELGRRLTPVMSTYPDIQHRIGARLRELNAD